MRALFTTYILGMYELAIFESHIVGKDLSDIATYSAERWNHQCLHQSVLAIFLLYVGSYAVIVGLSASDALVQALTLWI